MKKGISIWSFPKGTLEESFILAKKAGYDGVELALDKEGEVSLNSTKEDMEKVKALADKYGIELYSVATTLYWDYSMTSQDKEMVEKAKSIVRKHIDVASWLGCDTILVVPGAVGIDWLPNGELVDYDVAYE